MVLLYAGSNTSLDVSGSQAQLILSGGFVFPLLDGGSAKGCGGPCNPLSGIGAGPSESSSEGSLLVHPWCVRAPRSPLGEALEAAHGTLAGPVLHELGSWAAVGGGMNHLSPRDGSPVALAEVKDRSGQCCESSLKVACP
ncbi:hypothetical protein AMECASPLE_032621 [Ameca splendens]|uniref:Uncharacterized protein n=1 Tax=Ameca splendens TaxID=208324 RepID=A0ABV0Z5E9_9TELE